MIPNNNDTNKNPLPNANKPQWLPISTKPQRVIDIENHQRRIAERNKRFSNVKRSNTQQNNINTSQVSSDAPQQEKTNFSYNYSAEEKIMLQEIRKLYENRVENSKKPLQEGAKKTDALYNKAQDLFLLSLKIHNQIRNKEQHTISREDMQYLNTFIYELALTRYSYYKNITKNAKKKS